MKSGGSKFVIFVSVLLAVTLASAQDPPYLYDLSMFNGDSQALTADNLSPAVTVAINDYNDYNDLRNRRRLQSFTKMSNELKDLAILPLPINPEKLSQILQKIAKACDYSDDESRAVLQNDPFVRKVVNACISEGDRAESEGEFLKAYTDY